MTLLSGSTGELKKDQKKFLNRAIEWSDEILKLVTGLLNLTKTESGLTVQKLVPLKVNEFIAPVLELIQPQADKKDIKINCVFNGDLPSINADLNGMKDVFTNLLTNAVKYSDEHTEIKIISETDNDYLKIAVEDQGFGIKKEDIPYLFDKFFRVKNDKTRYIMGSGLGLPIVKQIVELHRGIIKVSSKENKGSIFTVYLPMIT
jgi:signal transduction histidine kinase